MCHVLFTEHRSGTPGRISKSRPRPPKSAPGEDAPERFRSAQNSRSHFSGGGRLPPLGGVVYHGGVPRAPCWEVATSTGPPKDRSLSDRDPHGGPGRYQKPPREEGRSRGEVTPPCREGPLPLCVRSKAAKSLGIAELPARAGDPLPAGRDAPYLCGLPRACARLGKSPAPAAAAAAAVATVKTLGPGRGTAQPEYRAPRASRPKRI